MRSRLTVPPFLHIPRPRVRWRHSALQIGHRITSLEAVCRSISGASGGSFPALVGPNSVTGPWPDRSDDSARDCERRTHNWSISPHECDCGALIRSRRNRYLTRSRACPGNSGVIAFVRHASGIRAAAARTPPPASSTYRRLCPRHVHGPVRTAASGQRLAPRVLEHRLC